MKRMSLAAIAFAGAAIFGSAATASAQTPTTTMTPVPTTTVDTAKAQDTTSAQATTTQTTTTVETTTVAEPTTSPARSSSCTAAPAVASGYLREQGGRLKMPRSAVIAEITKETGADGEFAGLKPCDSGYPNAVRFIIDEVIKAGTDHSTPQG